ncbi:MAG TPA: DNA repair protein RadA [bacterium]|nr:DNA repair protein RadA [bacterium]HOL47191.1 DNA repair protein RadA [bacterium]HPQ17683.1 DNA repair protein RadA [bacterium]
MKVRTQYQCQNCGYISINWLGKCPECQQFNSFEEYKIIKDKKDIRAHLSVQENVNNKPIKISDIKNDAIERVSSGSKEFDRVLGGGFVKGSIVLLGGAPGIGKSTIILQSFNYISKNYKVLYSSGEEGIMQIKNRASRLKKIYNPENLILYNETEINTLIENIKLIKPEFVVVDSIQTIYDSEFSFVAGTISQIRECTYKLLNLAKLLNITVLIIGHLTKGGEIAGPRLLEHMVDTVLYFEGERTTSYRILRTIKNRFGPTNEIGLFEMTAQGLIEVDNPAIYFLSERLTNISGSTITATIEGTRPIIIEVQALVTTTNFPNPRRLATGLNLNRLLLIIAILEKRLNINLGYNDVFLNIVGGINIDDTGIDLSVAIAIFSNYKNIIIKSDFAFLGELGLGGEVRSVSNINMRILEFVNSGFKNIFIPSSNYNIVKKIKLNNEVKIIPIKELKEVLKYL